MRFAAISMIATAALLWSAPQSASTARKTAPSKSRTAVKSKTAAKSTKTPKKRRRPPPVSPELRKASLEQVHESIASPYAFENPAGLVPFFERLFRMKQEYPTVHVLHYGDSHTASDDLASAIRDNFQQRFGDGGPGFFFPGRPFTGYRRYDVGSVNSRYWTTLGTMRNRGDTLHGLSGLSITSRRKGETATVIASGEEAELFYLQQPGGGTIEVYVDSVFEGEIPTAGELGPARAPISIIPGERRFLFKTKTMAPVRLLGMVVQYKAGVTWETLGINGATAAVQHDWDETILATQLRHRDPSLIVIAYGTNEANSRRWEPESYTTSLGRLIERFRRLSPTSSILLLGPPDCRLRTMANLDRVIDIQRSIAAATNCAFWDWRARMGGPGTIRTWVRAGMAQNDHIHFTQSGYQLAGQTLYADLIHQYEAFLKIRTETQNNAQAIQDP